MAAGWHVEIDWRRRDIAIVSPAGEVDLSNAEELEAALEAAISAPPRSHIVCCDLKEVSFIDSCGLGALVAAQHCAAERADPAQ